jgi:hypothetical protein
MAIDFADVDRDGLFDMFQVDMLSRDTRRLRTQIPTHTALPKMPGVIEDRPQMQRNTLFLNRGDGSYAQIAELANVDASGWSWSALFSDVDLDGWEDILIGTGHPWDLMDAGHPGAAAQPPERRRLAAAAVALSAAQAAERGPPQQRRPHLQREDHRVALRARGRHLPRHGHRGPRW